MRVRINTHAGQIRAAYDDDWETGTTLYEVTGTRVSGVFTICIVQRPYHQGGSIDPDTPAVAIGFGRPTGKPYERPHEREDRPIVNGVRLGWTPDVDTAKLRERRLSRWDVGDRHTPEKTAERTACVVEGLLTHWLTRPENYALRLAAVRHYAMQQGTRNHLEREVKDARRALREAMDALNAARARAAEGAAFAALPPATYEGYGAAGGRPG